jgi:hypothetical protein
MVSSRFTLPIIFTSTDVPSVLFCARPPDASASAFDEGLHVSQGALTR